MQLLNIKSEIVTLTPNEVIAFNSICQFKADGIDLIYSSDVDYNTSLTAKEMRGVLASMVKNGLISIDHYGGSNGIVSIYWELLPETKEEVTIKLDKSQIKLVWEILDTVNDILRVDPNNSGQWVEDRELFRFILDPEQKEQLQKSVLTFQETITQSLKK